MTSHHEFIYIPTHHEKEIYETGSLPAVWTSVGEAIRQDASLLPEMPLVSMERTTQIRSTITARGVPMRCELFMEDGKPRVILSAEYVIDGDDGSQAVRDLEITILQLLCGWDGGSADELSDDYNLTINLVTKRGS